MKKVGLLCGREWSWPPKFLEEVNGRNVGVVAEFIKLGGTKMDEPNPYSVIIDRISHEVPYYRSYLKKAVLDGVAVINNPFMWTADDKFFGATLLKKLGLAHPKTIVLPNQDYVPGIVKTESLRNLVYPMDWQAIVDHVGLPCILKDAHGGGWRGVYVCHSMEELIRYYDTSGLLTMIAQEFIEWDQYVRCMCIGQHTVLPMPYDPHNRRYIADPDYLNPKLKERIIHDSLKVVQALGYDMNTVEWAVKDGIPYAIDFMNPAPDMDINSLTPTYFEWCVKAMADLVIDLSHNPRSQVSEMRWSKLF
ncbi:MAG: ATP-grasp domain-containing protein [Fimbriiglobus sp.]